MKAGTLTTLAVCLVLVVFACILLYVIVKQSRFEEQKVGKRKRKSGILGRLEDSDLVQSLGKIIPSTKLERIFNRAKNPWGLTVPVFQCIRYGGLVVFGVLGGLSAIVFPWQISATLLLCAGLCWYYPMYFYKAIGNEREAEWCKMYEFIWVIKHNIMLYDPQKAYMNCKIYIEEHAPHNKEIIQGFSDFYEYWDPNGIDPHIDQYYPFSIPREITQIVFNMTKTGEFPEEQLNSLRQFIINVQDLSVEKILSGVSSKATIYSLPFLMVSVIIALLVPMIFQIINFI